MPASKLRHFRIDRGETQYAIARAAGISCGRFSMIERQLVDPNADERTRIARALGTSEATLWSAQTGECAETIRL
jgi:transcriptional regulator with XRE-family HTH domain